MQQTTFASMAWQNKGKITRRERFLAELDAVIPWSRLLALMVISEDGCCRSVRDYLTSVTLCPRCFAARARSLSAVSKRSEAVTAQAR